MIDSIRDDQLFTPEELAASLRIEPSVVYLLLQKRELRGIRLGRIWRIRQADVNAFIEGQLTPQVEAPSPEGHASVPQVGFHHRPRRGTKRFRLLGRSYKAASTTEMAEVVLKELAKRDKQFLQRLNAVKGRTRRYIARNQDDLYEDRPDLGRRYSKPLAPGWWMGTNYSRREIELMLRRACEISGLRYGVDLVILPESKKLDVSKAMAFVGKGWDHDADASLKHDELFAQAIMNEPT